MRRFILLCISTLFLIIFPMGKTAYGGPGYFMSISSIEMFSGNTYEFEVYLRSSGPEFLLTSYQCAIFFNADIFNGGTLNFSYVEGSSAFTSMAPSAGISIDSLDGVYELTFASMPGSDNINKPGAACWKISYRVFF